jgi:hypothetical protein
MQGRARREGVLTGNLFVRKEALQNELLGRCNDTIAMQAIGKTII